MKCKICGHLCRGENALQNMNKHYRKDHPNRPKKSRSNPLTQGVEPPIMKFCPTCGKPL